MALTYTKKRDYVTGDVKVWIGSVTFDSSLASGGESVDLTQLGFSQVFSIVAAPTAGYVFDWDGSATAPKLVAYPSGGVQSASKTVAVGSMTDGGSTSGYIDFATGAMPSGAIPVASKFACSVPFSGDTSAVWKLGISGDLDRYSADTAQSCFTAITTMSLPKAATGLTGTTGATTPRLTITTAVDFTTVFTAATAAGVATLYYLVPGGTEATAATDLSATSTDVIVTGI